MTDNSPQFKYKIGQVVWLPKHNRVDTIVELGYDMDAPYYMLKELGLYIHESRLETPCNLILILWGEHA